MGEFIWERRMRIEARPDGDAVRVVVSLPNGSDVAQPMTPTEARDLAEVLLDAATDAEADLTDEDCQVLPRPKKPQT